MPTTRSQAKKRKHVPSAPTTAETTKRKTPRGGTNSGRPHSSSGPTSTTTETKKTKTPRDTNGGRPPRSSGPSTNSKKSAPHRNNQWKGLSRDHCRQVREKLLKNLGKPRKSQPKTLNLHTENQPTRKLRKLDQYQLSETSNFGLPIDQSIHCNGIPVLPYDLEDWSAHLQIAAKNCLPLIPNENLLMLDVGELAKLLELETNDQIYVSYEQLKSIDYEQISRDAQAKARRNAILSLSSGHDSLTSDISNYIRHNEGRVDGLIKQTDTYMRYNEGRVDSLFKHAEDTSKQVQKTSENVDKHETILQSHRREINFLSGENKDRKSETLILSARVESVERTLKSMSSKKSTDPSDKYNPPMSARRRLVFESPQIPEEEGIISDPGIPNRSYGTVESPGSGSPPAANPSFESPEEEGIKSEPTVQSPGSDSKPAAGLIEKLVDDFQQSLVEALEEPGIAAFEFRGLNDANLPNPVKFLQTLIDAAVQGKVCRVTFNGWECANTHSDEIIMELAILNQQLPGGLWLPGDPPLNMEDEQSHCLILKDINFGVPYKRDADIVRNLIVQIMRLDGIDVENHLPPRDIAFDRDKEAKDIYENLEDEWKEYISLQAIKIITRTW